MILRVFMIANVVDMLLSRIWLFVSSVELLFKLIKVFNFIAAGHFM